MKKYLYNLAAGVTLALANITVGFAQTSTGGEGSAELNDLVTQTGAVIYHTIVDWVSALAGAIVVGMIVWGGLQYIQSNTEGGKKTIISAIIGTAIIILGRAILSAFENVISG